MATPEDESTAAHALMRASVLVGRRNERPDLVAKFGEESLQSNWQAARQAFTFAIFDGEFTRFDAEIALNSAEEFCANEESDGAWLIQHLAEFLFRDVFDGDADETSEPSDDE